MLLKIAIFSILFLVGVSARGHVAWNFQNGNTVESKPNACAVNGGTNQIFYGDYGGKIVSLDANTGKLIWKYQTDDMVRASPAVWHGDENPTTKVFVLSGDENVYCLNGATGSVIWKVPTGADYGQFGSSSPAVLPLSSDEALVILGDAGGFIMGLNATDGSIVWQTDNIAQTQRVFASPIIIGNNVYIGSDDGQLHALNALTGESLWNFQTRGALRGGVSTWTNNASGQTLLFFGSNDYNVYALDATDGSLVFKFPTLSFVSGTPAVLDDGSNPASIIVGSYDFNVYSIDVTTGKQNWAYTTADMIIASPTVVQGYGAPMVYIGSNDKNVYALDASTGKLVWNEYVTMPVWSTGTVTTSATPVLVLGTGDNTNTGSPAIYAFNLP